jgi:hypothetical protein
MTHIRLNLLVLAALLLVGGLIAGGNLDARLLPPNQQPTAEFVVTSSRDAGPGSLRDAILAADRVSTSAHITIKTARIELDSALPALVNAKGVAIEAAQDSGWIDANHQPAGVVLQVHSAQSSLKGLHIVNAHDTGIAISAPGVQLSACSVSDSKVAVLLNSAANGSHIDSSVLEHNETALLVEPGTRDITVVGTTFRNNSRAGFWFVGPAVTGNQSSDSNAHVQAHLVDDVFEKNTSGLVLANQPTWVQKSHFVGSLESAVVILGGSARLEDNEIRESKGTAVSVTGAGDVLFSHNTLSDNAAAALIIRDSAITVQSNTLLNNKIGIVAIVRKGTVAAVLKDNLISKTGADAITLIGGSSILQRNQITDSAGAAVRELDLVEAQNTMKVTPRLEANTFKNNGVDVPAVGIYKLGPGS